MDFSTARRQLAQKSDIQMRGQKLGLGNQQRFDDFDLQRCFLHHLARDSLRWVFVPRHPPSWQAPGEARMKDMLDNEHVSVCVEDHADCADGNPGLNQPVKWRKGLPHPGKTLYQRSNLALVNHQYEPDSDT